MAEDQLDLLAPSDRQLDNEWLLLNSVRETFSLASATEITYSEAAIIANELAPKLISEHSPIIRALEAQDVLYYRERATAISSTRQRRIAPASLVEREIAQLKKEMAGASPGLLPAMESRLKRLKVVHRILDETKWTETQLITRDVDAAGSRHGISLPQSGFGQGYREYKLSGERQLRVRVFHPDPSEWESGVDLVYEHYWKSPGKSVMVRVAALQYKRWNGRAVYTSDDPRLETQLERATNTFCLAGLCDSPACRGPDWYRLPHCAAFLRPTDKVQNRLFWKVTKAWHVPVCIARGALEETGKGGKRIGAESLMGCSVNSDSFRNMYNRGMIGSRWMTPDELDAVYQRSGLLQAEDRAVLHAQVYRSL